ncbi:hypothetical protein LS74_001435 [Helicobacter magdeburgensis]|uniref:Uncharacterized protein n=1 Tax=Helicobacter magdeburgensis TaxID=471858 RepID=A0A4U8T1U2_9HELI|nr:MULTISPECIES: hypothetical protein [Helicobacter]TLD93419.1 hypothetical protein LS74_001435 [Helicobacter magdeburgensis]
MFCLDEYISDLQLTSANMLGAYINEKYKDNKEFTKLISLEIIKHLDIASLEIERKLNGLEKELKDKE